jgi:hypothetical protein
MPYLTMHQEHLQQADRHIEEAEQRIVRQRDRMETLARDGHRQAAATAESVLQTMLDTLEVLKAHRRILRREPE